MAEERVQRRLAAILAADVVGYSRLIEADEEGTRAHLRSLLVFRSGLFGYNTARFEESSVKNRLRSIRGH